MKIFSSLLTILLLFGTILVKAQNGPTPVAVFAQKIAKEKAPQIIDARSAEEFALNHINGAIYLSPNDADYEQKLKSFNSNKSVFVYSIGNGRSAVLAKDLRNRGFQEVYELEGGIGSWVGAGNAIFTNADKPLSKNAYDQLVASNKVVLVDVGSKYCGACKKVKPVLETIRSEYGTNLKIVEIELEDSPQVIADLKTVKVFPTLILYQNGKIVYKNTTSNYKKVLIINFVKSHEAPHRSYKVPLLVYYPDLDRQFQQTLIDPLIDLLYCSPISSFFE